MKTKNTAFKNVLFIPGSTCPQLLPIMVLLLQAAAIILICAAPTWVDALYLVCGPRGFFYSSRNRRDLETLLAESDPLKQKVMMKMKRGIVERCCHRLCTIYHLEDYCS
uniref:Preproinsulin b n=1 Tax=Sinocyclocheilus anshuiensis TaxID=1608454 RepID=A0A671NRC5_9TELE